MMLHTCTIQMNFSFSTEAAMVLTFRVSVALQPLATALFANSPFTDKPKGYPAIAGTSGQTWTHTAPGCYRSCPRVGSVTNDTLITCPTFPMYFVFREGRYIDAAGFSFRDFLNGELQVLPGAKLRESDWIDHLSPAFPEVLLESFLEMRGADGGPWNCKCAPPTL